MRIIGVMSGTSLDGTDVVLLDFQEGMSTPHMPVLLARHYLPYPKELQQQLVEPKTLLLPQLTALHVALAEQYVEAICALPGYQTADVIGLHGQTVWHQPNHAFPSTLQLGNASMVALQCNVSVVSDFRSADMAVGGQGAPLVPFAHWFMLQASHPKALVVNIGGICNITWLQPALEQVLGYDIGPGMMLLDGYIRQLSQGKATYDRDGQWSRNGKLVRRLLTAILQHPFVQQLPPKSTGREVFGMDYLAQLLAAYGQGASKEDIAYTLAVAPMYLLQQVIARHAGAMGTIDSIWLVGGGAYHPSLQAQARSLFQDSKIYVANDGPMAPNNVEAAAMAILAGRTWQGLPSNLPQVTGARQKVVLGQIYKLASRQVPLGKEV